MKITYQDDKYGNGYHTNLNFKVVFKFYEKIEYQKKQQKEHGINGRVYMKSTFKIPSKKKDCGTLYATAQTFQTK